MQTINIEFAKKHWMAIVGGLFGAIVLYYLYENLKGGSQPAPDYSGGADQVQALSAAASLNNAQINAGVETSQLQAGVASQQVAAQLQATLAKTAADLTVQQQTVTAQTAVALDNNQTSIAITGIQGATVQNIAAIEGNTQVSLAKVSTQVQMAQLDLVKKQFGTVMQYSKHFIKDITALAPIFAVETGQGATAASLAQTAGTVAVQTGIGATAAGIGKGIGSVLSGLFA